MKKTALTLAASILLSGPLLADALDLTKIPAEARRLAHIDVSAFLHSNLWGFVKQAAGADLGDLEEFEDEFGINLLEDVKSITIYDTGGDARGEVEEAAALVHTTAKVDQALVRLRGEDGYRSIVSGDLTVHSWGDGGDEEVYAFVRDIGRDERLVLLSNNSSLLSHGITVLYGQAESLADARDPGISARPHPDAFLFLAASQGLPGMDWNDEASAVMNLADELVMEVGETRGQMFTRATIRAKTIEDARNLVDILNGVRALGKLALGIEEAEVPMSVIELIDSLDIHHRDRDVNISLECDVARLLEDLQQY